MARKKAPKILITSSQKPDKTGINVLFKAKTIERNINNKHRTGKLKIAMSMYCFAASCIKFLVSCVVAKSFERNKLIIGSHKTNKSMLKTMHKKIPIKLLA